MKLKSMCLFQTASFDKAIQTWNSALPADSTANDAVIKWFGLSICASLDGASALIAWRAAADQDQPAPPLQNVSTHAESNSQPLFR
jgi:hypothetical protein